jgi:hypothetical protein
MCFLMLSAPLGEEEPVSSRPRGKHAIEHVHPVFHGFKDVFRGAEFPWNNAACLLASIRPKKPKILELLERLTNRKPPYGYIPAGRGIAISSALLLLRAGKSSLDYGKKKAASSFAPLKPRGF